MGLGRRTRREEKGGNVVSSRGERKKGVVSAAGRGWAETGVPGDTGRGFMGGTQGGCAMGVGVRAVLCGAGCRSGGQQCGGKERCRDQGCQETGKAEDGGVWGKRREG